jgi:hypothetical protein
MDMILMAVTGLSLAMAAGMGAMLLRTLRMERRRSDARVELLQEMAAVRPEPPASVSPQARTGTPTPQPRSIHPEARVRETPATSTLDDFEFRPGGAPAAAAPEIFEQHEAPSAWPRRLSVIGGLAAVHCAVFLGWRAPGSSPAVPASASEATTPTAGEPAGTPGNPQPLELLSLQHAQEDGTLVISGLVQNPRGSAPLLGVQAAVVLFSADGGMLASSRAPIDFATLAPGDESSFVVRVPATAGVARYRVGFRGGDDRVLGHVDRRNNETVARRQTP